MTGPAEMTVEELAAEFGASRTLSCDVTQDAGLKRDETLHSARPRPPQLAGGERISLHQKAPPPGGHLSDAELEHRANEVFRKMNPNFVPDQPRQAA